MSASEYTAVDPDHWVEGAVPRKCWQIQRVMVGLTLAPETPTQVRYGRNILRGTALYASKEGAVTAAKATPYPSDGGHLSLLVVQQGCTDLADPSTAVFLNWHDGRWM